jgi:aspartate/methionine/tyrosine aminotransferase
MPLPSQTVGEIRAGVFAELQQRIDAYSARGGDLVPLQIGDTCLAPPEAARFAAVTDEPSLYRYGPTAGLAALRAAIADRMRDVRGFSAVDAERNVLVGCGGTHALACVARAILDPGDDVLLCAPYWPLSHGIIQGTGARAIEVPFTDRLYRDPSLDAGTLLREAATDRTRAIYLITPNNPDGKVLSAGQLASIAELARERDLWVIADEVYADHLFDAPHLSIANLPGMRERTLSAYSLSKSHALAGARVGYVIAPEEIVRAARRVSTHSVFNVPLVGQRVALAAIQHGDAFARSALETYRAARDACAARLRALGIGGFSLAEGGTYLFLDFGAILRDRSLNVLLERAVERGVLLAPGEAFGLTYARWARLCYTAVPLPRTLEGIDRLAKAIEDIA